MRVTVEGGGVDLGTELGRVADAVEAGAARAVESAIDGTKQALRAAVGPLRGARVARTIRAKFYPNAGTNPAGIVYSKAPDVLVSITTDATVYPRNRKLMAIPTPNAPRRIGGRRATPALMEQAGYDLEEVVNKGGLHMLIATGLRASFAKGTGELRGFRRRTRRRLARGDPTGALSVVMFWLIPRWRMRQLLSLEAQGDAGQARLEAALVAELAEGSVPGARRAYG